MTDLNRVGFLVYNLIIGGFKMHDLNVIVVVNKKGNENLLPKASNTKIDLPGKRNVSQMDLRQGVEKPKTT